MDLVGCFCFVSGLNILSFLSACLVYACVRIMSCVCLWFDLGMLIRDIVISLTLAIIDVGLVCTALWALGFALF